MSANDGTESGQGQEASSRTTASSSVEDRARNDPVPEARAEVERTRARNDPVAEAKAEVELARARNDGVAEAEAKVELARARNDGVAEAEAKVELGVAKAEAKIELARARNVAEAEAKVELARARNDGVAEAEAKVELGVAKAEAKVELARARNDGVAEAEAKVELARARNDGVAEAEAKDWLEKERKVLFAKTTGDYAEHRIKFQQLCLEADTTDPNTLLENAKELRRVLQYHVDAEWRGRKESGQTEFAATFRQKDACIKLSTSEELEEIFDDDSATSGRSAGSSSAGAAETISKVLPDPITAAYKFSNVSFTTFSADHKKWEYTNQQEGSDLSVAVTTLEQLRVCATLLIETKFLDSTRAVDRGGTPVPEKIVQLLAMEWFQAAAKLCQLKGVEFLDSSITKKSQMLCVEDGCFTARGYADIMTTIGRSLRLTVEVKPALVRNSYLAETLMQSLALSAARVTKQYATHSWRIDELLDDGTRVGYRAPGLLFTFFKLHIVIPETGRKFLHQVVPEDHIVLRLVSLLKMLHASSDLDSSPTAAIAGLSLHDEIPIMDIGAEGIQVAHEEEARLLLSTPPPVRGREGQLNTDDETVDSDAEGEGHDAGQENDRGAAVGQREVYQGKGAARQVVRPVALNFSQLTLEGPGRCLLLGLPSRKHKASVSEKNVVMDMFWASQREAVPFPI